MLERDSKIFNIMLALRSSRKGSRVQDPSIAIISDIFKRLAMPRAITERDFESLMNLTIAKVVDTINAQATTVFLLEDNVIRFKYIYYSPTLYDAGPGIREKFEETKSKLLQRGIEMGQGVVGKVIANNEVNVVEDTAKDPHFLKAVDNFTGFDTKSMITVPLHDSEGKPVGAIQVLNKWTREGEVTTFTPEDVELLKGVAEYSSKIFQKMADPQFHLSPEDTAGYIAKVAGCDFVDLKPEDIEEDLVDKLDPHVIEEYGLVPLAREGEGYRIATADPMGVALQEKFERERGRKIATKVVTTQGAIKKVVEALKERKSQG